MFELPNYGEEPHKDTYVVQNKDGLLLKYANSPTSAPPSYKTSVAFLSSVVSEDMSCSNTMYDWKRKVLVKFNKTNG